MLITREYSLKSTNWVKISRYNKQAIVVRAQRRHFTMMDIVA